jgi:hypothetical protein
LSILASNLAILSSNEDIEGEDGEGTGTVMGFGALAALVELQPAKPKSKRSKLNNNSFFISILLSLP